MPVLSRLLDAGRRVSRRHPQRTSRGEHNRPRSRASPRAGPRASPDSPLPRERGGSSSHVGLPIRFLKNPARPAQPPEPILIPKLRIQLADFPYLHCSVCSEADHLGDRLRTSVRHPGQSLVLTTLHSHGFSMSGQSTPDATAGATFYGYSWVRILGRTDIGVTQMT